MLLLDVLVLSYVAIAVTYAEVIDCTEFVERKIGVKINGEIFEYSDVELYYIYDKDHVLVDEYPDGETVNLGIKNSRITFRGIFVSNSVINQNHSYKAPKALSTNTVGVAKKIKSADSTTLSHCKFAVKKQSNAKTHWPRKLENKILQEVGRCLQKELCPAVSLDDNNSDSQK